MAGLFPHGTTLTYRGVPVGGLQDVPIPSRTRDEVEVTDHNSQFNREFVPGLIDNGQVTIPLRMIPGDPGQEALVADVGNPEEIHEIIITLPEHANPRLSWRFQGWVQTLEGTLPWENTAASRSVTFRVTGTVTEGSEGVASQLFFGPQPVNGVAAVPLTSFSVEVRDGSGNLMDDYTGQVTLTIGNNPGGGSLSGATQQNAASGVATFTDVEIDEPGDGYTLVAHASGLPSKTSASFDIAPS